MNIALDEWTPLAGWMPGYCCLELVVYLLQHFKKISSRSDNILLSAHLTLSLDSDVSVHLQLGYKIGSFH